jgi:hypothetical protein
MVMDGKALPFWDLLPIPVNMPDIANTLLPAMEACLLSGW